MTSEEFLLEVQGPGMKMPTNIKNRLRIGPLRHGSGLRSIGGVSKVVLAAQLIFPTTFW